MFLDFSNKIYNLQFLQENRRINVYLWLTVGQRSLADAFMKLLSIYEKVVGYFITFLCLF